MQKALAKEVCCPNDAVCALTPKKKKLQPVFLVLKDSLGDVEVLSKQSGDKHKDLQPTGKTGAGERLRDFCGECVESSSALERSPAKHNWFRATSE